MDQGAGAGGCADDVAVKGHDVGFEVGFVQDSGAADHGAIEFCAGPSLGKNRPGCVRIEQSGGAWGSLHRCEMMRKSRILLARPHDPADLLHIAYSLFNCWHIGV